ncbi:unnamed protein product [Symbiodinium natans]|uniref:Uncharacterized protein n=1 Tax=Symbiodinium natans TaxID=878477 RepID=A0A812QSD0_9DINO|nr:unnamed protein product [Symbiodinium natans]
MEKEATGDVEDGEMPPDGTQASAFLTEPELSSQWEDTSYWLSMVKNSISSSISERETLIAELKQVLQAATRERVEWQKKVKAMRRFRIPPEPGHWHESVTSALTWRAREVEALQREITLLEMRQRGERRDMCQLRARQSKRSTEEASSFCSRSSLGGGGFTCREKSQSGSVGWAGSCSKLKPLKSTRKPRALHVILEPHVAPLARRRQRTEVQPLSGGLCSRARRGDTEVYMWGWEPNDVCFQDQEYAFSSYTLPDVPRLGHREAIVEAQLLHEVMSTGQGFRDGAVTDRVLPVFEEAHL